MTAKRPPKAPAATSTKEDEFPRAIELRSGDYALEIHTEHGIRLRKGDAVIPVGRLQDIAHLQAIVWLAEDLEETIRTAGGALASLRAVAACAEGKG